MAIQVRDVNAFAAAQNLVIARFYLDEAQSGAAENRTQLKKVLRACERGEIGMLIIPSLDRLSCGVRVAGVGETGIGGAAGALAVGNEPSLPFVASLFSIVLSYLEGIKEE